MVSNEDGSCVTASSNDGELLTIARVGREDNVVNAMSMFKVAVMTARRRGKRLSRHLLWMVNHMYRRVLRRRPQNLMLLRRRLVRSLLLQVLVLWWFIWRVVGRDGRGMLLHGGNLLANLEEDL